MSYSVSRNTELANTGSLLLKEIQVRFLWAPGHIFVNQPIHNLVLRVFVFKATYLIYMVDPLTLNSWPTALRPEGSSPNTHISSMRHSTAFQHLETLDITSSLCFGAILNNEITNRKHKKVKNMALNRSRKAPFLEWEQSGITKASHGLVWPQLGRHMSGKFFIALFMSKNEHTGVRNKF